MSTQASLTLDKEWRDIANGVKVSLWGEPLNWDYSLFWDAKFFEGDVRPGWDYASWLSFWWSDVKPRGTKGCHTTLRP